MYKLIGSPRTRAFRVMWAFEELGLSYELDPAGPGSAAVTGLHPSAKVPVLIANGTTLIDSTAIMTYLADRHGGLTHTPGTLQRAQQDALTHFVLDEIDSVLWTISRHTFILPAEHRVPDVIQTCAWEITRSLDRLSAQFSGPFLTGDTMTIADIIAVHCLGWAHMLKIPIESAALKAYSKDLRKRDAYKAAQARAISA
ncbi:MAG: glutathione S-transferase family protein [Pseudomonadota bacterium]